MTTHSASSPLCISCRQECGYNRVVVDLLGGIELGGFCRRCELDLFGVSLERGIWRSGDDCVLCEREGQFALPVWRPYTDGDGVEEVVRVDYRITDATVRLCDEHLNELQDDPERSPRATRRCR